MKLNINKNLLALIVSCVFCLLIIGGFVWLWTLSQSQVAAKTTYDQKYRVVELGSTITDIESKVAGFKMQASLPVTAPTADRVGKPNPFVGQ